MTKEKTFRLLPCRTEADIRSWLSLSPPAMNKVLELEGFGVTNSLLGAPNSSIVSVLQQMVQQRPVGSSGGVSLSVTEAGNVISLLNKRFTPPAFVLTRCPCVCIHTTKPPTQGPRMSMHPEMRERVYGNDASSHHHKLWAVPTQRRRSASSSVSGAGTWYPARENHPLDLVASTDLQPASTHSAAALAPVYFESSFCIQMFLI